MNADCRHQLEALGVTWEQAEAGYRAWLRTYWDHIIQSVDHVSDHHLAFKIKADVFAALPPRLNAIALRDDNVSLRLDGANLVMRGIGPASGSVNELTFYVGNRSMSVLALIRDYTVRCGLTVWIEATEPMRLIARLSEP